MDSPEPNNFSTIIDYINTAGSICSITGISILFVAENQNADRQEMLKAFVQNGMAVIMGVGIFGFSLSLFYPLTPLSKQPLLMSEKILWISMLMIYIVISFILAIVFFFKGIIYLIINIGN